MNNKYVKDAAERIIWTAVQASVAVAAVYVAGLPEVWIAPAAAVVAAIKTIAAQRIGDKSSAAIPLWVEMAVAEVAAEATEAVAKKAAKRPAKKAAAKKV